MQDKDEAEWILERLFQKLEGSLRAQARSIGPVLDHVEDGVLGRDLQ